MRVNEIMLESTIIIIAIFFGALTHDIVSEDVQRHDELRYENEK
jgi:hypothetical protein